MYWYTETSATELSKNTQEMVAQRIPFMRLEGRIWVSYRLYMQPAYGDIVSPDILRIRDRDAFMVSVIFGGREISADEIGQLYE